MSALTPLETELLNALKSVMPILTAVRYQVGFGKQQEKRIDLALAAIEQAELTSKGAS